MSDEENIVHVVRVLKNPYRPMIDDVDFRQMVTGLANDLHNELRFGAGTGAWRREHSDNKWFSNDDQPHKLFVGVTAMLDDDAADIAYLGH